MSIVTCKQRHLHENDIVQYFQNYKCYDADRDYFRKYKVIQLYTFDENNDPYKFQRPVQFSRALQF